MKIIIDRFENDFAVCEMPDGQTVDIPRIIFENAAPGDVINISIDYEETDIRRTRIKTLMEDIWED